ncbi:hypothetical protein ACFWB0_02920 [Rhodococcus sp. NPDC060086]|uniref:hypothetical protein n=1 Tax=Rhodococcus sp. NPDC060086 TaxID=3347055 RepID=UPI00365C47C6
MNTEARKTQTAAVRKAGQFVKTTTAWLASGWTEARHGRHQAAMDWATGARDEAQAALRLLDGIYTRTAVAHRNAALDILEQVAAIYAAVASSTDPVAAEVIDDIAAGATEVAWLNGDASSLGTAADGRSALVQKLSGGRFCWTIFDTDGNITETGQTYGRESARGAATARLRASTPAEIPAPAPEAQDVAPEASDDTADADDLAQAWAERVSQRYIDGERGLIREQVGELEIDLAIDQDRDLWVASARRGDDLMAETFAPRLGEVMLWLIRQLEEEATTAYEIQYCYRGRWFTEEVKYAGAEADRRVDQLRQLSPERSFRVLVRYPASVDV